MNTTRLEQARAAAKAWRAKYPERARAMVRTWRANNPERVRATNKTWYIAHSEQVRVQHKAWKAANPERVRALRRSGEARRRARIARVLATLTSQEWEAILEAAGRACIYCGSRKQISMDHLVPISRGGPHTAENIAPACLPCNDSKGAKTVMEFLAEEGTT